jgi:hypothetical protein
LECKFIGYPENSIGYRFYHPDKGLIESRDAAFIETTDVITPIQVFDNFDNLEVDQDKFDHNLLEEHVIVHDQVGDIDIDDHDNDMDIDINDDDQSIIDTMLLDPDRNIENSGRRKRKREPSKRLKDHYVFNLEEVDELVEDPRTFKQAMDGSDSQQWQEAMEEEIDSIKKNEVWELVDLPTGRKPIGCKWVLRKKFKADGTLDRYKARLVAKGYTQKPGIDFVDTYSPVAKFQSIRILMAIIARMDLELHQLDVKTAFLNGDLKEDIYMAQPEGFHVKEHEDKVYKLKKSLYGLKQSSRQWYLKFHQAILEIGYQMNRLDHCVYTWKCRDKFCLLSLYVDDILLAGNCMDMITKTKSYLGSKFEMKDMGEASYVLGIKITRDRNSKLLYLDQENYLDKIFKRFNMLECNPVSTPVSKGTVLTKEMCPTQEEEVNYMKNVPYAQAVGSLMYAMTSTRPDICHAVGLVSRYQSNPGKEHWQAVKRIIRYLKGTQGMKLCFGISDLDLICYSDADFAGDLNDRKSTSGNIILFGGTAVSWLSKKQGCVAKSTMEAEYISCSTLVSTAVWAKRFIDYLNIGIPKKAVDVFCDNKSAIFLIKSGANSSKGKHIDVKYHYIQDIVERGEVKVDYIPSEHMVADPMTKGLTLEKFREHVGKMGLKSSRCD